MHWSKMTFHVKGVAILGKLTYRGDTNVQSSFKLGVDRTLKKFITYINPYLAPITTAADNKFCDIFPNF